MVVELGAPEFTVMPPTLTRPPPMLSEPNFPWLIVTCGLPLLTAIPRMEKF